MENTLAAPDSGQRRKEKENLKMENTLDVHLSWERLYTCLQNVKTCPYCPSVIKITTSGGHIIGTYLPTYLEMKKVLSDNFLDKK